MCRAFVFGSAADAADFGPSLILPATTYRGTQHGQARLRPAPARRELNHTALPAALDERPAGRAGPRSDRDSNR